MKTTIFGAGAVGGHLAARLGAAGADVSAVCRGEQLAAIRERGITLHIHDERYHSRLQATDRPQDLGPQDLVIVTAKSSVLPEMASSIATLCGPDTAVVFAMNGIPWWYLYRAKGKAPPPDLSRLDPDGALAREIGHERVIGCMINSANEVVEPGVIRNSPMTKNKFTLGDPDGTVSRRIQAISDFLEAHDVHAPITETIRVEIWDKLLRNLATSPICALTGEPIGVVGRHPELFDTSRALMREGLAVAQAHGIDVADNFQASYGARPTSPHKSSMLQDFERNRPPEIDGILTSVQAFAHAAHLPTPTIDAVTSLVIEKARRMGLYPKADW
ncbi:MAG TPA: 2-dehydropantoate 2-reductase [Stellaceae bacterium]|jgi:2-dehydropantoate 2-reductase|nr:2-dehydropantoate 2-reductase [Stellaceae bacterium]